MELNEIKELLESNTWLEGKEKWRFSKIEKTEILLKGKLEINSSNLGSKAREAFIFIKKEDAMFVELCFPNQIIEYKIQINNNAIELYSLSNPNEKAYTLIKNSY